MGATEGAGRETLECTFRSVAHQTLNQNLDPDLDMDLGCRSITYHCGTSHFLRIPRKLPDVPHPGRHKVLRVSICSTTSHPR